MSLRRLMHPLFAAFGLVVAAPVFSAPSVEDALNAVKAGNIHPARQALALEERPELKALLAAHLAAVRLDADRTRQELAVYEQSADDDVTRRRSALALAARTAFAAGRYGEAAAKAAALEKLFTPSTPADERQSVEQLRAVAEQLMREPVQSLAGPITFQAIPAQKDKANLPRTDVHINRQRQQAVIDSGANLSVLSKSAAERLGIRMLEGQASVGNGVQGTVPVRLGIAEQFEFAGTRIANMAFLVLDDEQLSFPLPGGYTIDAIVGFPVLRALGRVRFTKSGTIAVEPAGKAEQSRSGNLYSLGNDLFVDAAINGTSTPLFLDTGATTTRLSARYAAENAAALNNLEVRKTRMAGAGGRIEALEKILEDVELTIDGKRIALTELPVDLPSASLPKPMHYGVLGNDILNRFDSYVLDFSAMRLEFGQESVVSAN